MAQLIWAPSALKDIDLIALYISKDSVQAAENIVDFRPLLVFRYLDSYFISSLYQQPKIL